MIETTRTDGLVTLTLNRPQKANALTRDMLTALADQIETLSTASPPNALIITGRGKVFSAGADLEAAREGLATDPIWERLSGAVADAPFLTIAALNGTAAGGSLGMVLACDIRIAVPQATFFYPVMRLGFLPQPSDSKRLAALVGPARAKLMLLAGQKITTDDALTFGLVDRVSDTPLDDAVALATDALAARHAHVQAIKSMI